MIATVMLWDNGQVLVFDAAGAQLPDFQGQLCDVQHAILAAAGPQTLWRIGAWRAGTLPSSRAAFAAWRFGPPGPAADGDTEEAA